MDEYTIRSMYIDLLKSDKDFMEQGVMLQKYMDDFNFEESMSPIKVGDTISYELPEKYK